VLDFRLTSSAGTMLCIGRSNYLRFNHPAEARLMKSILPNARISMAPLTLYSGTVSCRTPGYPWHRSPSIQVQYPAERPDIHGTAHPLFRYSILPNARISMAPLTLYSGTVSCRTPGYPWHRSPSIQVQYCCPLLRTPGDIIPSYSTYRLLYRFTCVRSDSCSSA